MAAVPELSNVRIRAIDEVAEMRAVEELQKQVWGIPDLDVVPVTQLVASKEAGGVLIGAFDGATLVGFVYGFPSYEGGKLAHHSHMLAVKPAYRNFDLGRRLKFAQRDQVVTQGVELISWTFDPLQRLNAHFNFNKLGVIADRYLPDFYGEDAASFLHQTGTDRLWVSWFVSPERRDRTAGEDEIDIEIPWDINALVQHSPEAALQWRAKTRRAFIEALEAGYVVTEFRPDQSGGKYLLSKS
jgi:predicted GNAT superfamily acetyltransferase